VDSFEVGVPGLHDGVGLRVAGGEVEDQRVEQRNALCSNSERPSCRYQLWAPR
jgi:hypothetical protein